MAAPTATTRQTPSGLMLKDGFSTLVTLKRFPNIQFWEKTVTPPGVDGGDAIEATTMHNIAWRTMYPRQLRTMTDLTTKVAYDPYLYTTILSSININDEITVRFPDGSTVAFWGFLRSFTPDEAQEGQQPEATVVITPTNRDNSGVEQAPVVTQVAGT